MEVTDDLVRQYLSEIGQVPLLTAKQETDLARRIEAGRAAAEKLAKTSGSSAPTRRRLQRLVRDGEVAKHAFVTANLRLVVSIAKRYAAFTYSMNLLDLIQEGNLGLFTAVEKFDYRRGFKFSTYATLLISQAITRGITNQDRLIRLPANIQDALTEVNRAKKALMEQLRREPSPQEIAEAAGLKLEEVELLLRTRLEPMSLDQPIGDDGTATLYDIASQYEQDPLDIDEDMIANLSRDWLYAALRGLSQRQREVMALRFGLVDGQPRTLQEVGKHFDVTREWIRQIEAKTLRELRDRYDAGQLLEAR